MEKKTQKVTIGTTILVKDKIDFVCPFCKKKASAGFEIASASPADTDGIVLHEIPVCKEYADNEPDEYLQLVNRRIRG